jgi:hypothetical protein
MQMLKMESRLFVELLYRFSFGKPTTNAFCFHGQIVHNPKGRPILKRVCRRYS